MYHAIKKYGWENVKHNVLFKGLSKEEAEQKEIELIASYNTTENGYNIEHGGNTTGTHSEETKRKISIGNKGKSRPCTAEKRRRLSEINRGAGNPFYGKTHSKETKDAHSKFMQGNNYFKGHHHTEEYKQMKSEQMHEKYKDGNNPKCKPVLMENDNGEKKVFYSLRQASRQTGITLTRLQKIVKNGQRFDGCLWRYANG